MTKFSAAIDLDLLEPVVDFSIDRLHRDLQPRRRHWLRQADDVPVFVTLSFDQNQIIINTAYTVLQYKYSIQYKGGVLGPDNPKMQALPEWGGGLTLAWIFVKDLSTCTGGPQR